MSFLRDFMSFRKKDIKDYPPDVVLQVKSEDYKNHVPFERNDCLLVYLLQNEQLYEIVLQKAIPNHSLHADYSLSRFNNAEEAMNLFKSLKDKLPFLCNTYPSLLTTETLQDIVNYIRLNPKQTLPHIAAHFGFTNILKSSINNELSKINHVCPDTSLTALHVAVKNARLSTVISLMTFNPNLNLVDNQGNNVFHFAASVSKEMIAALCVKSSDTSGTSKDSPSEKLKKLINQRNNEGITPLHKACLADKPDCVKELLKNGADPNGASILGSLNEINSTIITDVIDQLDSKVMKKGGNPLHWVKSKQCMEVLIKEGCNINAKNFLNETVLYVMVSRKLLPCIVTLLSHGAEINTQDSHGNTPLHVAVKLGEVSIVQALVVFGANVNSVNFIGESPRHVVASNDKIPNQELILYILHTVGAKRCAKLSPNCNDGCALNATFNGIPQKASPFHRILNLYENYYSNVIKNAILNKKQVEKMEIEDSSPNQIRLLCLDGGGIRGLILIQMLSILEKMMNKKIIECFDWFAGTSTGGILALALALGKSAPECRQLYFRLKDKIFVGMRPYDSEPFEKFVQKEFGIDKKMCDIVHPRVMLTATVADRFPALLYLFRNYQSPQQVLTSIDPTPLNFETSCNHLLWMAARSSGAAPTYFPACGKFLDGGLISNNPTLDALTEITQLNAAYDSIGQSDKKISIEIVVSLGTGLSPVKNVSTVDIYRPDSLMAIAKMALSTPALAKLLVDQVSQANGAVVERAKAWCYNMNTPYFRLNPSISEDIGLDETDDAKLINMLWETCVYMHNRKEELEEMIFLLIRTET